MFITSLRITRSSIPASAPGSCSAERECGVLGELHPLVREHYDLPPTPFLAADLDLDLLLNAIPAGLRRPTCACFPADPGRPGGGGGRDLAGRPVEAVIRQAVGRWSKGCACSIFIRVQQVGIGKKSLAYSLTYQADDRTLTDKDAAQIRQRIIRRLEQDLGAKIRS